MSFVMRHRQLATQVRILENNLYEKLITSSIYIKFDSIWSCFKHSLKLITKYLGIDRFDLNNLS